MRLHFLIVLFIATFTITSTNGQTYERKSFALPDTLRSDISQLTIDSSQNLIVFLENGEQLYFNGYRFRIVTEKIKASPGYPSDVLENVTSSFTFLGNQYFSTSENGLWVQSESGLQKWFYPEVSMPDSIQALSVFGDQLFLLERNGFVYEWNESELELTRIHYEGTTVRDIQSDLWGNLWLGHEDQITRITFKEHESDQNTPKVSLSSLTSSLEAVPLDEMLIFEEPVQFLHFKVETSYLTGSPLWYQYQIYDEEWSDYSSEPSFTLPYLSTGNYSFRARATADRQHYGYTDIYPFHVKQSIWKSWWPFVFGGIFGLGLLWWFSNRIQNRAIKGIQKEKEKIILENQLLKSQQKTMQLQMNPHFLFNALNGVSGLIATGHNKEARKYLGSFSQMMRSLLDQSREDAISIKDEISFLKHYLSIEQMCRNYAFEYEINVDNDLDLNHQIPSLLIQPIVENAVIHGMKSMRKDGLINIKLSSTSDRLFIEVEDNGLGYEFAKQDNTHESVGLKLLQERIDSYSKFKQLAPIKIIDKSNQNPDATGTIVTLEIPFI